YEDGFQLIGETPESSIRVGVCPPELTQPGTTVKRSPIEELGTVGIGRFPVFPHGGSVSGRPATAREEHALSRWLGSDTCLSLRSILISPQASLDTVLGFSPNVVCRGCSYRPCWRRWLLTPRPQGPARTGPPTVRPSRPTA